MPAAAEPDWTPGEESAMVNGFDEGLGIAAIAALLGRDPRLVRDRLHAFGRLPACDPVRAAEDWRLGGPRAARERSDPPAGLAGRWLNRLLRGRPGLAAPRPGDAP